MTTNKLGLPQVVACSLSLLSVGVQAQHTVTFSVNDRGQTKSVAEWGVDTAWPSFDNVRQSVENIGADNVDVVRLTFYPGQPVTTSRGGGLVLSDTAKGLIDDQLALAAMAGTKPIALLPGEYGNGYDALHWERTIKATQEYINSLPGWSSTPIHSIEAFNEPDFWAGQGSPTQLNALIGALRAYPEFQNTEFPAGSVLNSDQAWNWYNPVPNATQGSSHLLGGSLASYVAFIDHVHNTGRDFVNPELHSLGEAIIGADRGMVSGIWWADALRARGLFAQASDGSRLGYAEDIGRQSAAAVYRAPDGEVYGFAGGVERFGETTAYRFVSTDQDVYFNGIPVREYVLHTDRDKNTSATDNDFQNFGSWSNQGAYVDIDLDDSGVPALDGYRWKIVNAQDGSLMEVVGGNPSDGGLICSASDDGGLNQLWEITRTRNGYYHLFNAATGRTAEVAGLSLNNGADVRQWGTADNAGQQWFVEEAGGGDFFIRNTHSHKYLDAELNGTNIFQWDANGGANQKWQFVLANPPVEETRVGAYPFDGNPLDSHASGHGIATGSPAYTQGVSGQAIDLDGANDYVTLPSDIANSDGLTVATWVKWDGGGDWQRVFDFGNDTSQYLFLTPRSGAGTMRFAITPDGIGAEHFLETDALPTDEWTHLAVTLGGNTAILYVNGEPRVAGQVLWDPSDFSPTNNYIGKSQFNDPLFDGVIDDFQVFDYALDATQIVGLIEVLSSGDFDGDGVVDAADYTVWRDNLGSVGGLPYSAGDANGDGDVTQADYEIWRAHYGQVLSPASGLAMTVPEPSSLSLAFLLLAAVSKHKSRCENR